MENQNIPIVSAEIVSQNAFIRRVYSWMGLGLALTAVVAFLVLTSQTLVELIFGNIIIFFGLIIAELVLVIYLSARVQKISLQSASIIFLAYSALNGLTLAVIFLAYTGVSVFSTFVITAGMFFIVSVYGATTKKDLTSVGQFAFTAFVGVILAMIINLFLASDMAGFIISCIAVIIFVALAAYDTQKLKQMNASMPLGSAATGSAAIFGALTLYLDFVNLFINLLRILGRRRS